MKTKKSSTVVTAVAAVFVFLYLATSNGTAALEAKRMSDLCNASFGFRTPDAIACLTPNEDVIAIAALAGTKSL
jgi:hypothetical protein